MQSVAISSSLFIYHAKTATDRYERSKQYSLAWMSRMDTQTNSSVLLVHETFLYFRFSQLANPIQTSLCFFFLLCWPPPRDLMYQSNMNTP
jgi:hypothetical protein